MASLATAWMARGHIRGWFRVRRASGAAAARTGPRRATLADAPPELGAVGRARVQVAAREVQYMQQLTLSVVGAPALDGQRGTLTPDSVLVHYQRFDSDGPSHPSGWDRGLTGLWAVSVEVHGRDEQGLRDTAYFSVDGDESADDWPAWLGLAVDQLHPARPGGWPGSDPEGSYL